MFLIIGLGNPDEKYKKTWHNFGFWAIDKLAKQNKFADFKFSKKLLSFVSKGKIGKKQVVLAKPQTFVNNSGKAVNALKKFYKLKKENIVIIHDDLDLKFGSFKIAKNRGSAGHKGVESIFKALKTKNFLRIRLGTKKRKIKDRKNWVLKVFSKNDEKIIKKTLQKLCLAIETIITEKFEKAMSLYNQV